MTLTDQYTARDELVACLRRDLVGPQTDDERLVDPPFRAYLAGVLYPVDAGKLDPENEVDEADDAGEATYADPPVSLANARYPSSMGLTFAVDTNTARAIDVAVEAARYVRTDQNGEEVWARVVVETEPVKLGVGEATSGEQELEPGLHLFYRVRTAGDDGAAAVTIVLINRRVAPPGQRDEHCYFQARIAATTGTLAAFVDRTTGWHEVDDPDLESYRLIYRDVHNFAVGHGSSVRWDVSPDGARAQRVATETVPTHELLLADSNPEISTDRLSMLGLATEDRREVMDALSGLAASYQAWIETQQARIPALPEPLQATAGLHLDDCREALGRMSNGVESLNDAKVFRAFQLANLAMLRQRSRAAWVESGRPDSGPVEDDSHRWRPFQIAFILLNIEGIDDPKSTDRERLDLLWFPTGGGKTEAYLGLIAFTIALRRMRRGDAGRGVTVLMRYTLRLVTIQQFERASSLICALEHLRRESDDLGTTPITIGLWVGRDGTPSTLTEARVALDKLRSNAEVEKGNPVQVRACPWCGMKLDHKAYWIAKHDPRLVISCRSDECDFHKGLPICLVDEDIYREKPTLIIATADKFATLPWVKNAHALFGIDDGLIPPELIVQDELHLISGPLGTLAGLYEAAIDLLCTSDGIRPKIVASTATIRRAAPQVKALFDRDMRQFPPPGLDASDSFFSVEAPRDAKGSRLYLGALAPGTSQSTLMIRTYAALMQGIADLDVADDVRDPFWTLVGYFNSLRVLGGARIQVLDDVRERLRVIVGDHRDARLLARNIELTSREPSSAIPGHLGALARSLPDDETLDYVLATNMISVGVDVDRLGLMVVSGQPQATAEYIQATSRVGRRHPGLVATLYNAGRSRDRSHYESFPTYHEELYRQVESTSVTPFSPRARDRALSSVLFSLARVAVPAMRENGAAADIEGHVDDLRALAERIAERADRVDPGAGSAVRQEFDQIIDRWRARNQEAPKLVYTNPRDPVNSLLTSADQTEGEGFPTPSSLRDVDKESNLYLVRI